MIQWTDSQDESTAQVEGLGEIRIHQAKGGVAVDINGQRVWSCWKGSLEARKRDMESQIRAWQYLNSFKA